MSTLTLILWASDPEMQAIEDLGHQVGAEIRYALSARGGRVRADEAYQYGTPEQIEAFMRVWAPAQGLTAQLCRPDGRRTGMTTIL